MERIFRYDGPNAETGRAEWIKKRIYLKSKMDLKGFQKERRW
ncbi:hypothetical protein STZ1_20821 [Bacillus subtilis]